MTNAKRILIECEMTEIFKLSVTGPEVRRLHCLECGTEEQMLDVNAAADISGVAAREILRLVEASTLHSPETATGHLLICRASLEDAINADARLRRAALLLKESL